MRKRTVLLRGTWFGERELGFVAEGSYVDLDVKPGSRRRYMIVLERPDGTRAPASSPVDVVVPRE